MTHPTHCTVGTHETKKRPPCRISRGDLLWQVFFINSLQVLDLNAEATGRELWESLTHPWSLLCPLSLMFAILRLLIALAERDMDPAQQNPQHFLNLGASHTWPWLVVQGDGDTTGSDEPDL
uniref:Uncharacterized protein n=1 Tax=Pipistrellus kuhlii TaxID=59472 RepID=A0A7J7VUX5_PIPKU|nr:hypothetical protein mPipKuh1_008241 [Pipistrellus kuhlii]